MISAVTRNKRHARAANMTRSAGFSIFLVTNSLLRTKFSGATRHELREVDARTCSGSVFFSHGIQLLYWRPLEEKLDLDKPFGTWFTLVTIFRGLPLSRNNILLSQETCFPITKATFQILFFFFSQYIFGFPRPSRYARKDYGERVNRFHIIAKVGFDAAVNGFSKALRSQIIWISQGSFPPITYGPPIIGSFYVFDEMRRYLDTCALRSLIDLVFTLANRVSLRDM